MSHLSPSSLRPLLNVINQVHDLSRKLKGTDQERRLGRNLRRISDSMEELGLSWHDPIGESYNETRTDCEASIAGTETTDLVITETLKPIIRIQEDGHLRIVQRAVVVVSQRT